MTPGNEVVVHGSTCNGKGEFLQPTNEAKYADREMMNSTPYPNFPRPSD